MILAIPLSQGDLSGSQVVRLARRGAPSTARTLVLGAPDAPRGYVAALWTDFGVNPAGECAQHL